MGAVFVIGAGLVIAGFAWVVRILWNDLDELQRLRNVREAWEARKEQVGALEEVVAAQDDQIAALERLVELREAENDEWAQKCRDLVAISLALDLEERTS